MKEIGAGSLRHCPFSFFELEEESSQLMQIEGEGK